MHHESLPPLLYDTEAGMLNKFFLKLLCVMNVHPKASKSPKMRKLVNVWMDAGDPSCFCVQEKKVHPLAEKRLTQENRCSDRCIDFSSSLRFDCATPSQIHILLRGMSHLSTSSSETTHRGWKKKCVSCLRKQHQTSGLVYFSAQQPSMSFLIMF